MVRLSTCTGTSPASIAAIWSWCWLAIAHAGGSHEHSGDLGPDPNGRLVGRDGVRMGFTKVGQPVLAPGLAATQASRKKGPVSWPASPLAIG